MNTTISAIKAHEDGGYSWTETDRDETTAYSTNDEGFGLWQNGRQILGTAQFNLSDCSASTRRRRVQKFMNA